MEMEEETVFVKWEKERKSYKRVRMIRGELVWHSVIEKETDSVKRITIRSNREFTEYENWKKFIRFNMEDIKSLLFICY